MRDVFNATLSQLARKGFDSLSIPDIAVAARVNKTSIYRRWPEKAELVSAALTAAMGHADQPADTGNLRDDLVALSRSVADFQESEVGASITGLLLNSAANPEIRALAQTAYGTAIQRGPWVVIARAVERGEWQSDMDPSPLLFMLAGRLIHRILVERIAVTATFLEQTVDLVLFGVAGARQRQDYSDNTPNPRDPSP